MRKPTCVLIFMLILSFLPFQKTFALSCIEPPPPEVAFHEYDVVVIATVTSMKSPLFIDTKLIEADVSLSLKGYNGNTITFAEDQMWGESHIGTEYLLFLNKNGDRLESPLCSATTRTVGLDRDKLIKTLAAEASIIQEENTLAAEANTIQEENTLAVEANTIQEENIYTPKESLFSWGWIILFSIIIVLIATLILHKRRKGRVNNTD